MPAFSPRQGQKMIDWARLRLHGQRILWSRFWMAMRKGHGDGYTLRTAWKMARICQWVAAGKFYGMKYPVSITSRCAAPDITGDEG